MFHENLSDSYTYELEINMQNDSEYDAEFNDSFWDPGSVFSAFINPDYILIGLYVPVFLLSLAANLLVIVVVIKYQYMRNVTNLFLVNLSVADLLVTLLCIPIQIGKAVTLVWLYGENMCKTTHYFQGVAVSSSVFTITAMSVDRYLAIVESRWVHKLPNRKSALLVILMLWMIALAIFSPLLWILVLREEKLVFGGKQEATLYFCSEEWTPKNRRLFGILSFTLVYAIPGIIMLTAYSLMGQMLCSVQPPFDDNEGHSSTQQSLRLVKERKRIAWILLLLAILFAFCWLPYNGIQLLLDTECISESSVYWILPYALLLGHMNSAINPIVYCFLTKNFRRSVKKLIFGTPVNLPTRNRQQRKMLNLNKTKKRNGTQVTNSGTRVSRRLQCGSALARHLPPGHAVLGPLCTKLSGGQPPNDPDRL